MSTVATAWGELRAIIEHAITNTPRSLQTALGPSELGTACDKCLVHMLAGHQATEHVAPWLPTIGSAVHAWLEEVMHTHNFYAPQAAAPPGDVRWMVEEKLLVGQVGGVDIWGSCDLFDVTNGIVWDYKLVGKTTLDSVRRHGAKATYQRQVALYAAGWARLGYDVNHVAIAFLPRNAVSLQHALVWDAPYDPAVAADTLQRANALHAGITGLGVQAVLAMTPAHTGQEFACDRWPTDGPSPDVTRQLAGLVPSTPGTSVTGSTALV